MTATINENTLQQITRTLNKALIQRGFPVVTTEIITARNEKHMIEIESEKFNTTPVIMKSIQIDNFGGSISIQKKNVIHVNESDPEKRIKEVEYVSVWIPVHISYEHFSGGTNGTELFSYHCEVFADDNDTEYVQNEVIS